ncbi:hypothetical protein HDU86_001989 [Geranomyces michiganensis]|nr:hypothetical protein HDU86_001989 [Geranomyces michiganensis]
MSLGWVEAMSVELQADGYMNHNMATYLLEIAAAQGETALAVRLFKSAVTIAEDAGEKVTARAYAAIAMAFLRGGRQEAVIAALASGEPEHGFRHYEIVVTMLSSRRDFKIANLLLPAYISALCKSQSATADERNHAYDQAVLISVGCGDLAHARHYLSRARRLKSQNLMVEALVDAKPDLQDSVDFLLQVVNMGLIRHVVAYNAILRHFYKHELIKETDTVWETLIKSRTMPNVHSFQTMIMLHAPHGGAAKARGLVTQMVACELKPNLTQWVAMLAAFSRGSDLGGCRMVFDHIRRLKADTKSYTAMMDAIVKHAQPEQAAQECDLLVEEMTKRDIALSARTHTTLMRAHSQQPDEVLRRFCILEELRDVQPDEHVYAVAIDALFTTGDLRNVPLVFERMLRRGIAPTMVVYHALLRGVHSIKEYAAADFIYKELTRAGLRPSLSVASLLIDCMCKSGRIEDAEKVFAEAQVALHVQREPKVATLAFQALMNGYAAVGRLADCLRTQDAMIAAGLPRNAFADCIVMKARSFAGDYASVKKMWTAALAADSPIEQVTIAQALDSAGHLGTLADLEMVVKQCAERGVEMNENVRNSLAEALCRHSRFAEAVEVIYDMAAAGIEPTRKTYYSVIPPLVNAKRWEDARSLRQFLKRHFPATLVDDPYEALLEAEEKRSVESTNKKG